MRIQSVVLSAVLGMPGLAHADQLLCNDEPVAKAAAAMLPKGAILLDFCSQCEDRVRIVRVSATNAVQDCQWELEVSGRVVFESTEVFKAGYAPEQARFRKDGSKYLRVLDLAYVYVEVAPNDFRWLGGQLGLTADVKTKAIALPKSIDEALGQRPIVEPPALESKPKPVANKAAAPTRDQVAAVFEHWRTGDAPVLAHFVACLALDLKRGSATRYECIEPVTGPVALGTRVFAWADWLVPRGKTFEDASVEFVFDGEVRLSRKPKLEGRVITPVVPTTVGAVVSRRGIYTLRVRRGDTVLAEVPVEVR